MIYITDATESGACGEAYTTMKYHIPTIVAPLDKRNYAMVKGHHVSSVLWLCNREMF